MKNIVLTILLISSLTFGINAQTTLIPDTSFEQALINLGYDTGVPNGSVITATIDTITILNISGLNIADLTGIQDFIDLVELNCNENQLTNLDVTQNMALTKLYCIIPPNIRTGS